MAKVKLKKIITPLMSPKMATCMLVLTSSLVCTDKAGDFRLSSCEVLEVTWMSIKMLLVELAQELDYGTSLYLKSKLGKPIPNHKFRLFRYATWFLKSTSQGDWIFMHK